MIEKVEDTKITKEKKVKKNKVKKEKKPKKPSYIKEVRTEMKKVSWPTKKEVLKYTFATIVFCLVVCGFFQLLNLGLSLLKGMFE